MDESFDHIKNYYDLNPRRRLVVSVTFCALALVALVSVTAGSYWHALVSNSVVVLGWLLGGFIVLVVLVIMEISYRHEQNGIRAILEDLRLTAQQYNRSAATHADVHLKAL